MSVCHSTCLTHVVLALFEPASVEWSRLPFDGVQQLARLDQLDDGIRRLKHRYEVDSFIAYFQPATNTYAPIDRLRTLYEAALSHPKVTGLAVGTRPDCVSPQRISS